MTETARIMVTGSRDWGWKKDPLTSKPIPCPDERLAVKRGLVVARVYLWADDAATLISGAAEGADKLAEEFAAADGFRIERHPADWGRYGRAAGMIRNREMIAKRPHLVLAFQKNQSRGTGGTIMLARQAKIPVFIWSA